jgi:hypothetical protein
MDIETEKRLLVKADHDIAEGDHRIQRQIEILIELERNGHDTEQAMKLLSVLRESQQALRDHRDLIVENITRLSNGDAS